MILRAILLALAFISASTFAADKQGVQDVGLDIATRACSCQHGQNHGLSFWPARPLRIVLRPIDHFGQDQQHASRLYVISLAVRSGCEQWFWCGHGVAFKKVSSLLNSVWQS